LTKDRIRYCPTPYAITEIIINKVILTLKADVSASPIRSVIFSSAVSTISAAITITATMKIALLPRNRDDDGAGMLLAGMLFLEMAYITSNKQRGAIG
jgi:hypothetical protein